MRTDHRSGAIGQNPSVRQTAIVVSAIVLVAGAVALAAFLWLRTYDPLAAGRPYAPGAGLGADIEPTFGSGGRTVYIPAFRRGRPFDTTVTIRNDGRFAVTLLGIDAPERGPVTASMPADAMRLDPHDSASVVLRWRLVCTRPGNASAGQFSAGLVRLRYRYLSIFTRTAAVRLPFAVTLRCSGGPPDSP
jgi:hypothetical protein